MGGNQYTDALQKELDLSYEDAERLKKGEAIAGVNEENRATILRSVSDILILEIQKTFDFFRATATGENIQHIYLAGGTARVPGLMDLLREEFALPVEELYPFRKIVINPGRHSEEQVRELAPAPSYRCRPGTEELRHTMIRINLLGRARPKAARQAVPLEATLQIVFLFAALLLAFGVLSYHCSFDECGSGGTSCAHPEANG